MQLMATMVLTLTAGVCAALAVALAVGLLIPAAKIPVFLCLSALWLWLGWQYAKARDQALSDRASRKGDNEPGA
jgi:membrane protein implicated in regulation of membrane protease activity